MFFVLFELVRENLGFAINHIHYSVYIGLLDDAQLTDEIDEIYAEAYQSHILSHWHPEYVK